MYGAPREPDCIFFAAEKHETDAVSDGEPTWPSSKALGWWAEGPRFDSASVLLSSKVVV